LGPGQLQSLDKPGRVIVFQDPETSSKVGLKLALNVHPVKQTACRRELCRGQDPARGVKGFISLQLPLPHAALRPGEAGLEEKTMTALLLGVGTLLLAVIAGALLDPRPSNTNRTDSKVPSMDEIVLVA
jgi:hypothetical protein